jgi:hypothetical protein
VTWETLQADQEDYLAEYTKRFGNVLNTDDAATLFHEYTESLETRAIYLDGRAALPLPGFATSCSGARYSSPAMRKFL